AGSRRRRFGGMLVAGHARLEGYADGDEVIARAAAAGLVHIVLVGQWREGKGMAGALDAVELAKRDRSFFSATAGIHPHDAAQASETDLTGLRRIFEGPDVGAGGGGGPRLPFHPPPRQ